MPIIILKMNLLLIDSFMIIFIPQISLFHTFLKFPFRPSLSHSIQSAPTFIPTLFLVYETHSAYFLRKFPRRSFLSRCEHVWILKKSTRFLVRNERPPISTRKPRHHLNDTSKAHEPQKNLIITMSTHLVSKSRHFHIPYFHHGIHSYRFERFQKPIYHI